MIYSLSGIIQPSKDINDANKQILDTQQILFCERYDNMKNSYGMSAIIETNNFEKFIEEFNETMNHFLQNYKES